MVAVIRECGLEGKVSCRYFVVALPKVLVSLHLVSGMAYGARSRAELSKVDALVHEPLAVKADRDARRVQVDGYIARHRVPPEADRDVRRGGRERHRLALRQREALAHRARGDDMKLPAHPLAPFARLHEVPLVVVASARQPAHWRTRWLASAAQLP